MRHLLLLASVSMLLLMVGCKQYNPFAENPPQQPVQTPATSQVYVPAPAPATPLPVVQAPPSLQPLPPTNPDPSLTTPSGSPVIPSIGTTTKPDGTAVPVDTRPLHQRPNPSYKPTPKPLNI